MLPTKSLKDVFPTDLMAFIDVLKCVREGDIHHDVQRLVSELEELIRWYREDKAIVDAYYNAEAASASMSERQYQLDDRNGDGDELEGE